jgi:hypothetical protein
MVSNAASSATLQKSDSGSPIIPEFSAFVQDEWKATPTLSISYGLRWEVNPAPSSGDGRMPYTASGDVAVPSTLTLSPRGTSLWQTSWYNFAPRVGVAWTAHSTPNWETVFRSGGGVFFDTGNQMGVSGFSGLGFGATSSVSNAAMPLSSSAFDFSTAVTTTYTKGVVYVFPRNLQLPYSLQWNASLDQALGNKQVFTASYVGSSGRRLLQEQDRVVTSQNPQFGTVVYFPNGVTSNYQALQLKLQRSVATGLQALLSYTWSHSLDYGSTYSAYPLSYGNSDFDVRHNFQGGVTWTPAWNYHNPIASALLKGWGIDGRLITRTAFPITLKGNVLTDSTGASYYSGVNYDATKPTYLYGSKYPGGRALNGGSNNTVSPAFTRPSGTQAGNAPRNFVRGFGEAQLNAAVRRDFHVWESLSLQFRAESFNIFNNANFGYVDPTLTDAQFGQATKMLNASLTSMSSLYQQGGARSMQLSLKAIF